MSDEEREDEAGGAVSVGDPPEADAPKLEMDVEITDAGPCKKHVKVSIPRSEIERRYSESLEDLRKDAVVPGFRPGRAPRQLIVKRFRKEVGNQVKSSLLMASLQQIDQDQKLDLITQPQLDLAAIELPDEGPLNYEMDVEVRPEFAVPEYKGLALKRPIKSVSEAEIDTYVQRHLERHGQIVPKLEGAAELGDYLTADLAFHRADGTPLNEVKEIQFRLQPELRYQDGSIPNLGAALVGARPGETREAEAHMGSSARDARVRGAVLPVKIHVHDLKVVRLPEITPAFLNSIGFDDMANLRDAVRDALKRRLQSQQRQALRDQVVSELLRQSPFELPADLVSREEANTIRRLVSELRREGMSDNEIRAREAEIRANAHESTMQSLKEILVLAKIAEAEEIKVEDEDFEVELESIAEQTGETVRRVRSRLQKEGASDDLATQILERKVLDAILKHSSIEDVIVDAEAPPSEVETLDHSAAANAGPEPEPETKAEAEAESESESATSESEPEGASKA